MQESDLVTLRQFPPRNVEQLVAQRDVLLEYADAFPVSSSFRRGSVDLSDSFDAALGCFGLSVPPRCFQLCVKEPGLHPDANFCVFQCREQLC